jgi:hypothetical protein
MLHSRRVLFHLAFASSAFLSLPSRFFAGQASHPQPQPLPSPNAPNPNVPQGLDGRGPSPSKDQKQVDRQIQQEIRADVDKMSALVAQMKDELSLTSAASVLSVNFVKQAHEVEKLAKHVKDLAKG